MIKKDHLKKHLLIIFTFPLLIVLSVIIYKDYGISIDEESTRMHGLVSLNYISNLFFPNYDFNFQLANSIPELNSYPYREYGVFFEIFLILIVEILFGLNEFSEIFYLRHLITNLFFLISLICFYFISLEIFKSKYFAYLSVIILYSSPRIFADSFYNDKDLVFLSFFIFSILSIIKFLKETNYTNSILLAFVLSITINIRVIGIYLLVLTIFFVLIKILMSQNILIKKFNSLALFIISSLAFLYFFWPFLWESPLDNIIYALKSFSKYAWGLKVFYLGEFYLDKYLPWHYQYLYFFATTSLILSAVILCGLVVTILRFINRLLKIEKTRLSNDIWKSNKERTLLLILFTIFTPLFLIYFFDSIIYNGWRHLFFIFPCLIIIGVYFVEFLTIKFRNNNFVKIIPVILTLIVINNIYNLINLHPFQYVYFNKVFEDKANDLFEIDYWGVANKQALKEIISNNSREDKIVIGVASFANLNLSKKMLPEDLKNRIIISGQEFDNADFIFTNYYSEVDPKINDKYSIPENFKKYSSVKKGNILIYEFYKNSDTLK